MDARETMMCAPPEEGTQVTLAQAEDSLWVRMSESAAGIMKAWPVVASEMRVANVFILEGDGGGVGVEDDVLLPCFSVSWALWEGEACMTTALVLF